jgi:hypothetical protein
MQDKIDNTTTLKSVNKTINKLLKEVTKANPKNDIVNTVASGISQVLAGENVTQDNATVNGVISKVGFNKLVS